MKDRIHLKFASGEGGIRTPGPPEADNGFRDRRNRPLCHFSKSGCKINSFQRIMKGGRNLLSKRPSYMNPGDI